MPRWATPPSIVAEALVGVPDPLLTALHPGAPASGAAVASSLARSLAPPEHRDDAPPWLLPEQEPSFRRVLAAVRHHGGAVLADPVGSGKTFVALAIAATLNRASTACLVPATLLAQWERAAERVGVRVTLWSHERASRGNLPQGTRGLVIIDESHRFRNPRTKRYGHLAPWLVGRATVLVTATPIVNQVADLAHQLLLAVRDNALIMDGIVSIRGLLENDCPAPALGRLVIQNEEVTSYRPTRVPSISRASAPECAAASRLIEKVSRLRLSQCQPIAALIRGTLLRAISSSPAALHGALTRYHKLLRHAADALRTGRVMDRADLRQFTGDLEDQLIWWELLPLPEGKSEIELGDLALVEDLIRAAEAASANKDGKLDRLRDLLADGAPTLVFTVSRDTVRYVRSRLSDLRVAWCTGERAGIGTATLSRRSVLGWFRGVVTSSLAPRHLIVTDVAAEGLDLQRAARVVHYDLPWTATRLEQREGRSVRYGSRYAQVEVVRFAAPPQLERLLQMEAALARKAELPATAGLGPGGRFLWRWRACLAEQFGRGEARAGVATVPSPDEGLLAGFTLTGSDREPLAAVVLWLTPDGRWTEAPDTIAARLRAAASQTENRVVDHDHLKRWLELLALPLRERLVTSQGRRWAHADPAPAARHLAGRLQRLVRDAARQHQASRLAQLERALAFVAGGHTAGEAILVERLSKAPFPQLAGAVNELPKVEGGWEGVDVRLTGLILFEPTSCES